MRHTKLESKGNLIRGDDAMVTRGITSQYHMVSEGRFAAVFSCPLKKEKNEKVNEEKIRK